MTLLEARVLALKGHLTPLTARELDALLYEARHQERLRAVSGDIPCVICRYTGQRIVFDVKGSRKENCSYCKGSGWLVPTLKNP